MPEDKNLKELAIATWRLEKWVANLNTERKMAAKSALRTINSYLKENNVEYEDITGQKFDIGLAVSVVNNETEEKDESKLIISEMVKPIITENGSVVQYGQVILGTSVKAKKTNTIVEATENNNLPKDAIQNSPENTVKNETNPKTDIEEPDLTQTSNIETNKNHLVYSLLSVILLFQLVIICFSKSNTDRFKIYQTELHNLIKNSVEKSIAINTETALKTQESTMALSNVLQQRTNENYNKLEKLISDGIDSTKNEFNQNKIFIKSELDAIQDKLDNQHNKEIKSLESILNKLSIEELLKNDYIKTFITSINFLSENINRFNQVLPIIPGITILYNSK